MINARPGWRYRQPSREVLLNPGHPLTRGLMGVWVLNDMRGIDTSNSTLTVPRNRLNHKFTSNFGTNTKKTTYDPIGGAGIEILTGGAANYFASDISTPTNSCTVFLIRKLAATVAAGAGRSTPFGTATTSGLGAFVPFDDNVVYWDFGGTTGSNRITWSGYTRALQTEFWTFVAGTKGTSIYFNGVQRATSSTLITSSSATFRICGGYNGDSDNSTTFAIGISNYEWTPPEVAAWYRDPYGMFVPEASPLARAIQVVAGGGGGGGARFTTIWLDS